MSRPELVALVVGLAVVTLAMRGSFIVLGDRVAFPPLLRRALTYVPPAVLAAIVAPALLRPSGIAVGPIDARLVAAAVAALVAWRTRSVIGTFLVGMSTLWLLGWLVGRG